MLRDNFAPLLIGAIVLIAMSLQGFLSQVALPPHALKNVTRLD